jgi:ribosomal-protein-alanine N-acetyltransferase
VTVTRLVADGDAAALAELSSASREFLAPWEPVRDEAYYTIDGQREVVAKLLSQHAEGTHLPHVILDADGAVAGRITLNGIVRGPFLSCSVGYWVDQRRTGRGLATQALAEIMRVAFDELGLHRIQGETLVDNVGSQRVLEHCGFERIGFAPAYLKIAGRWQDCILHQVLTPHPL